MPFLSITFISVPHRRKSQDLRAETSAAVSVQSVSVAALQFFHRVPCHSINTETEVETFIKQKVIRL